MTSPSPRPLNGKVCVLFFPPVPHILLAVTFDRQRTTYDSLWHFCDNTFHIFFIYSVIILKNLSLPQLRMCLNTLRQAVTIPNLPFES
jgi:hypothetical protein